MEAVSSSGKFPPCTKCQLYKDNDVNADEDAKNKAFDALQELVTNVQFANGMSLLADNLFGKSFC